MSKNFIFSSESVGEGHPDKVCDTISDAVLDACLAQDPTSRVACETYAKCNLVVVGGEITTKAKLDFNEIARQAIRDIGYTHEDDVFHADKVLIMNAITSQSPRSEEHTSELQSHVNLVCRLLLEKKKRTPHTASVATRLAARHHSQLQE